MSSSSSPGATNPNPLELDEQDAAEFARLMALKPDPEVECKRQARTTAPSTDAPARPSREQSRAARVAADYGLTVIAVLEDGTCSYAKAQPDTKVGDTFSVPAKWEREDEPDEPIPAVTFERHRAAVEKFAADVKHDRITRATGAGARTCMGHASRRREPRPRVARRSSSSSITSSDPPDASDESDPPSPQRQCAAPWCDRPVYGSTQKKFCGSDRCNRARAEERQRQHRSGDLTAQEREQLDDARRAGYVGAEAFAATGEHALSFLWKFDLLDGADPGEHKALLNRPACRCNGHHIDGGIIGCFKCGLAREAVLS